MRVSFKGISVNSNVQMYQPVLSQDRAVQNNALNEFNSNIEHTSEAAKKDGRETYLPHMVSSFKTSVPRFYFIQRMRMDNINGAFSDMEDYTEDKIRAFEEAKKVISQADNIEAVLIEKERRALNGSSHKKDTGFPRIAGYNEEKKILNNVFIQPVQLEKQGVDIPIVGSVLFFGPYNNGKTTITEAVAQEAKCNIVTQDIDVSEEKTFEEIKQKAIDSEKNFQNTGIRTIIFVDEIDSIIHKESPILHEFNEFLKTCSKDYHCTIFGATNDPLELGVDMGDKDIFPIKMSIDPADDKTKNELFKYYLNGYPKEKLDYEKFTEALKKQEELQQGKFTNGQIKEICRNVGESSDYTNLTTDYVLNYINSQGRQRPDITPDLQAKFQKDYDKLIEG